MYTRHSYHVVERSRAAVESIVADADEAGIFEATASSFDSTATGVRGPTRFTASAFDETVKRWPTVPLLWQHKDDAPIGTAMLRVVAGHGLVAKCKLTLGTKLADEAHALVKAGAVNSVSIGFTPATGAVTTLSEKLDGQAVRLISDCRVMEVSLVTFGADPSAKVIWVHKSEGERYIEWLTDPGAQGQRYYDLVRDLQQQAAKRREGSW